MGVLKPKMIKKRHVNALVLPSRKPPAKKGQIYRAKAKGAHGGYRYVKVEQVRKDPPHARVRECDAQGVYKKGRDKYGMPRSLPFIVYLTDGHLHGSYELVE